MLHLKCSTRCEMLEIENFEISLFQETSKRATVAPSISVKDNKTSETSKYNKNRNLSAFAFISSPAP